MELNKQTLVLGGVGFAGSALTFFAQTSPALAGQEVNCVSQYRDAGISVCQTGNIGNYDSVTSRGAIVTGDNGYGVGLRSTGPGDIEVQGARLGNGGGTHVHVTNEDGAVIFHDGISIGGAQSPTTITSEYADDGRSGEIIVRGDIDFLGNVLQYTTFNAKGSNGTVVICDDELSYDSIRNLDHEGNVIAPGNEDLTNAQIDDYCDDGRLRNDTRDDSLYVEAPSMEQLAAFYSDLSNG